MSNLFASIHSDSAQTGATRRGHRELTAHARGWNTGAEVRVTFSGGLAHVTVYRTTGSHGNGPAVRVAAWSEDGPTVHELQPPALTLGPGAGEWKAVAS